eukprot:1539669-Rhodomonas_salina.1
MRQRWWLQGVCWRWHASGTRRHSGRRATRRRRRHASDENASSCQLPPGARPDHDPSIIMTTALPVLTQSYPVPSAASPVPSAGAVLPIDATVP